VATPAVRDDASRAGTARHRPPRTETNQDAPPLDGLARAVAAFRAGLADYRRRVDELGDHELLGESSVWEWRCEQMQKGLEG